MQKELKYLLFLLVILLVKAGIIIWVISTGSIGLVPDEAQYWTWSQALDWGYYSKPPGIAWQIGAGTFFWGNTEIGIRFFSVIGGIILPLAVYFLARACALLPQTAFWAGTMMALAPLGVMGSLLAITDGGMMFFWTLACIVLMQAIEQEKVPSYVLIGTFIMLGALFKWPIYFFWAWVLLAWYFFPFLRNRSIFLGIVISILGMFPSVIWNASHQWATFQHVFSTVQGSGAVAAKGNVWEFIGAQAVLLSPLLFFFLLMGCVNLFKEKIPNPVFFGAFASFMTLGLLCGYALFKKTQGNWGIFIYPTLIVFLSWFLCEKLTWGKKALVVSLFFSVALSITGLSLPYLQMKNLGNVPYKWNPFKHNVGWSQLEIALKSAGYNPEAHFLFGDRYQSTSLLSFYGPTQKRAYFFNLEGTRKNQFSFWPGMSELEMGRDGFFVSIENTPFQEFKVEEYRKRLTPYFEKVEFIGAYPLFKANGTIVKEALIFKGLSYNGQQPSETNLW